MKELDLYLTLGLNVIPLLPNSKKPAIDWKEYQTQKYSGEFPENCNYGIVCGTSSSNLVVVDLDSKDLIDDFKEYIDSTIVIETGKGYHIYFYVLGKLPNTLRLRNRKGQHIDVQSSGTYVVAPPSIHPDTGTQYHLVTSEKILEIDFSKIIRKLEDLGFKAETSKKSGIEIAKGGIQEGDRHNSAVKYCNFLFFTKELDKNTVGLEMSRWNETLNPPLPDDEIARIIDDCKDYHAESEKSEPKQNQTVELYHLAKSKIKKICVSEDNDSEVYIIIKNRDHYESVNLDSSKARQWLAALYFDQHNDIVSDEYYKQALGMIKACARFDQSPRVKTHFRIAQTDDAIYYDLCVPDWKIVKITKDSISFENYNENKPLFIRTQHNSEQYRPSLDVTGDPLSDLARLLNIADSKLFCVHLVSFFLEPFAIPVMTLLGEPGSLKTTISYIVKLIVDPDGKNIESNVSPFSNKSDDLNIHVHNRYLSAFDNITNINQKISDTLCRFITGQSYTKRKLYHDSDEIILNFKRKLVLNGIAPTIEQADLIQRSIFYRLDSIPRNKRITEKELDSKIRAMLPALLGQIFKTLQKAMQLFDEVEKQIPNPERMSDFTIWGECISRALGNKPFEFLQIYNKNLEANYMSVGESHPIVEYMQKIISREITEANGQTILFEEGRYMLPVSDFYLGLKDYAEQKGFDTRSKYSTFPKHSNKLSGYVKKISPILYTAKLTASFEKYSKTDGKFRKNNTIIVISPTHEQSNLDNFGT